MTDKQIKHAYKSNLKLCKYQEQQINKLATCIEDIKEIAKEVYDDETTDYLTSGICFEILQKIREV